MQSLIKALTRIARARARSFGFSADEGEDFLQLVFLEIWGKSADEDEFCRHLAARAEVLWRLRMRLISEWRRRATRHRCETCEDSLPDPCLACGGRGYVRVGHNRIQSLDDDPMELAASTGLLELIELQALSEQWRAKIARAVDSIGKPRYRQVVQFVLDFCRQFDRKPTYRDLAAHMKIPPTTAAPLLTRALAAFERELAT